MDSASITENGAPVNITGRVMHDDRKGFDLYICRDFELGSDTKIYCRDFAEAPVRIGYSLYDTDAFEFKYFYGGTLGAIYSNEATVFRLWSPAASRVTLLLQENLGSHDFTEIDLVKGPTGVFQ